MFCVEKTKTVVCQDKVMKNRSVNQKKELKRAVHSADSPWTPPLFERGTSGGDWCGTHYEFGCDGYGQTSNFTTVLPKTHISEGD